MTLRLTLVKATLEVTIALDEGAALRAAAALWAATPCRGSILHSRRSGQEIFAILPPIVLHRENLVTSVSPGDVLVEVFPPALSRQPARAADRSLRGYTHLVSSTAPPPVETPEGYPPSRASGGSFRPSTPSVRRAR